MTGGPKAAPRSASSCPMATCVCAAPTSNAGSPASRRPTIEQPELRRESSRSRNAARISRQGRVLSGHMDCRRQAVAQDLRDQEPCERLSRIIAHRHGERRAVRSQYWASVVVGSAPKRSHLVRVHPRLHHHEVADAVARVASWRRRGTDRRHRSADDGPITSRDDLRAALRWTYSTRIRDNPEPPDQLRPAIAWLTGHTVQMDAIPRSFNPESANPPPADADSQTKDGSRRPQHRDPQTDDLAQRYGGRLRGRDPLRQPADAHPLDQAAHHHRNRPSRRDQR